MTFHHFGNCIVLAYLPYYLAYKYSGLSEYGAFWKCMSTGLVYAMTQLAKMMILATFFPLPTVSDHHLEQLTSRTPLALEFFKASMDLADLVGLYFALSRIPGRGHSKVLTAGIGWGTAELLFSRVLAIWVGAKGVEFNWRYIQMSLDANISLIHHITSAALVWIWSRHDVKPGLVPAVMVLGLAGVYRTFVTDLLTILFTLDPWMSLLGKATITAVLGFISMKMYSSVA